MNQLVDGGDGFKIVLRHPCLIQNLDFSKDCYLSLDKGGNPQKNKAMKQKTTAITLKLNPMLVLLIKGTRTLIAVHDNEK